MRKEKTQKEKSQKMEKKGFFKKHKKGFIILGIVLVIATGITVYVVKQVQSIQEIMTSQYATTTLEKRNIINSVSVNGVIASDQKKEVIIPLTNIEIQELYVEVGDFVSKGDVIGILDSTDIEESLKEAKQSLNVSSSQTYSSINSASKGLENTKESATIDEARAQESIDNAYADYASAGATEATALTAYNAALAETTAAKTTYDRAIAGTATAQSNYNAELFTAGVDMNTFEEKLNTVKAADAVAPLIYPWNTVEISPKLTGLPSTPDDLDMDEVAELTSETIAPWAEGSTDPTIATAKKNAIATAIGELISSQVTATEYTDAIALPAVSAAQTVLTAAKASEATSKTAYEAKKAVSDQKKIAYDSAKSTRETMADRYNSAAQSSDDIKRINETSIETQKDSVDSTKLSATTATTAQENQVEMYEEQLKECTIRAPFDGTITALNFEEGDIYSNMSLYTIQNYETLTIEASVDQYDISDIKKGMRVVFKTDTTGEEEMIGTVTFVSPVPEASTGMTASTNYPIEITIEKPNERLRLGMTAQANIVLEEVKEVFAVPYECIKIDADGNTYVNAIIEDILLAEDKNTEALDLLNQNTKKIFVETGLETDYYTEIRGKELEVGMIIQLSYLENSLSELEQEDLVTIKRIR